MANRLNQFISNYIPQDQIDFIPNRDISDNTIRLLHLITYCSQNQKPAIALAIDIEKAFDSIEFPYLEAVLKHMDCGPFFLTLIKALYVEPEARIKIYKLQTDPIFLKRGTRQGCPLPPLLFAIEIEPLAVPIRNS